MSRPICHRARAPLQAPSSPLSSLRRGLRGATPAARGWAGVATPRSAAAPSPGTAAAGEGRAATCRAASPPRRAAALVKHASQHISVNWPRLPEAARGCPRLPEAARGFPMLEAALSLTRRWWRARGRESAEASGRLLSTQAAASPRCLSWLCRSAPPGRGRSACIAHPA